MKNTGLYFKLWVLTLLSALLLGCEPKTEVKKPEEPQTPPNFTIVQNELLEYYNSGEYLKQLNAVTKEAMDYLNGASVTPGKSVLVLDIDDTSVTNAEAFIKTKFCPDSSWNTWLESAQAPAIKSVNDLYQAALNKGVGVVFITARGTSDIDFTEKNLVNAGYATYDTLILQPPGGQYPTSAAFKTSMREALTKAGMEIILNVGDQKSDVSGGYAKKAFKLPNPFYFTK